MYDFDKISGTGEAKCNHLLGFYCESCEGWYPVCVMDEEFYHDMLDEDLKFAYCPKCGVKLK